MATVGHAEILIGPELNNAMMGRFEAALRANMRRLERQVRPNIQPALDIIQYRRQLQAATAREQEQKINAALDTMEYRRNLRAMTQQRAIQHIDAQLRDASYRANLRILTRPINQDINANLQAGGYRARLQALTRPVRQTINVDVDRAGLASLATLGTLMSTLRGRIFLMRTALVALRPLWLAFFAGIVAALPAIINLIGHLGLAAGAIGGVLVASMFGAVGAAAALVLGLRGIADGSRLLTQEAARLHGAMNNWKRIADELAISFQRRALPGLENFLNSARVLVPEINAFFVRFGNTVRRVANDLANFVTGPVFRDQFRTILEGNSRALDSFGNVGVSVFRIVTSLAAGAVGQLERFADWLDRSFKKMADWLELREQTGQLSRDFERMGDAAAQWGRIVGNLFVTAFNILKAIAPISQQTADEFERLTARWREFTGSTEGQEKIRKFFQDLKNMPWGNIAKGLTAIAVALAAINATRSIAALAGLFAPVAALGPAATAAGIALGFLSLAVAGLVAAVGILYITNEDFRQSINDTAKEIAEKVQPVIEILARFWREKLEPAVMQFVETVLPALVTGLGMMADAFIKNEEQIGQLMDILAVLIPILGVALANSIIAVSAVISGLIFTIGFLIDSWNFLWSVGERIIEFLTNIWNPSWQNSTGVLQFFVNLVTGGWTTLWNLASIIFPGIANIITTVWNGIWGGLTATWNFFWGGIQIAWSGAATIAGVLWGRITATISGIWNGIWTVMRLVWDLFWSGIEAAWNLAVGIATTIWTLITNAISGPWNVIWSAMTTAWNIFWGGIQVAWNTAVVFATGIWTTLTTTISSLWNGLWSALRIAWDLFWGGIVAAWNGIVGVASTIWGGLSTTIQGIWGGIWNALRTLWSQFMSFITGAWNGLATLAFNIFNGIFTTVQGIWNSLWNALRALWSQFSSFISGAWATFSNLAFTVFNGIFTTVQGIWNSLWNALRTLWSQFFGFISGAWNGFLTFARTIFGNIFTAVQTAWNNMWNALRTLWGQFLSFITGAWNGFRTFAQGLWDGIRNTITGIWTTLWNTARSIWNTARTAIENSINAFRGNVINFFRAAAEGIKSWWDRIQDWAKAPVNFIIETVWNNGIGGLWGKVKGVFSGMPSFPRASRIASGGVMPGYTPGKDIHYAMLSGGEAVMRPEWTRAVGRRQIDTWNRQARTGQLKRSQPKVKGYTTGGIKGYASGGVADFSKDTPLFGDIKPTFVVEMSKTLANNPVMEAAAAPIGVLPDWVPGSGIVNNIISTGAGVAKEVAGKIVEKLFFHNPIVERAANAIEKGIDTALKGDGWEIIPRRFVIGLYDHALARIAAIAGAAGGEGSGGDRGTGSSALLQEMAKFVRQAAPGMRVSSGHRPGDPGYHGRSRAIDMIFSDGSQNRSSGQTPGGQAARAAAAIKRHFTANTLELIWDPLGNNAVWNGRRHRFTGGGAGPGTHNDHIHWAFGGTVEQLKRVGSGAGGITGAEAVGQAKFGSLDKATGLFKKYKDTVTLGGGSAGLVSGDGSVMQQAYRQAKSMGANPKVLLALFMAGFVESGFRNLNFGDRDSQGFLQQRPSQGWGTVSQIRNVPFATRSFVSRAMPIARRNPSIGAGALAQAVQRSAFPGRYEQFRSQAQAALRRLEPGIRFDTGGLLSPGQTAATNLTGNPEAVLTGQQWAAVMSLAHDSTQDRPIQLDAKLFIDGKEIDARIEAKQRQHNKELVRVATARRSRFR